MIDSLRFDAQYGQSSYGSRSGSIGTSPFWTHNNWGGSHHTFNVTFYNDTSENIDISVEFVQVAEVDQGDWHTIHPAKVVRVALPSNANGIWYLTIDGMGGNTGYQARGDQLSWQARIIDTRKEITLNWDKEPKGTSNLPSKAEPGEGVTGTIECQRVITSVTVAGVEKVTETGKSVPVSFTMPANDVVVGILTDEPCTFSKKISIKCWEQMNLGVSAMGFVWLNQPLPQTLEVSIDQCSGDGLVLTEHGLLGLPTNLSGCIVKPVGGVLPYGLYEFFCETAVAQSGIPPWTIRVDKVYTKRVESTIQGFSVTEKFHKIRYTPSSNLVPDGCDAPEGIHVPQGGVSTENEIIKGGVEGGSGSGSGAQYGGNENGFYPGVEPEPLPPKPTPTGTCTDSCFLDIVSIIEWVGLTIGEQIKTHNKQMKSLNSNLGRVIKELEKIAKKDVDVRPVFMVEGLPFDAIPKMSTSGGENIFTYR